LDPNRARAGRLVHLLLLLPPVLLSSPTRAAAQTPTDEPWYERMRFAGDFRVRHESFFLPDSSPRGRMRIRFRMGFTLPISPKLTTGLRLASSEPGSVTSHNVSLSGELTPKQITLDRAWLTWMPNRRVTLTAGKFANPLSRPDGLMRTEMVFDDEVSPEGLHEELVVLRSDSGLVRRLAVRAEQWSLRELANESDIWLLGGQVAGQLGFGRAATVSLAGSYLAYRHGDRLAAARNENRALLVTNAVVLFDGTIVEGGKAISPTTGNPFVRFQERFRLLNGSVGVTVPRAIAGLPVTAYVDAVHNAGADEHRTGYWAGISVGPGGRADGWAVTVLRTRVEREAVLSMYSYSDLGLGGTNLEGTILQVAWRPAAGILLSVRDHIIRTILPVDGLPDRALHRLQLDAGVSF
jgi:hypothetical protein